MTKISQLHQKWLKDPEYKIAYEEMALEFEIASAIITENLGLKPRPSCSVPMSEGTSDGAVRF